MLEAESSTLIFDAKLRIIIMQALECSNYIIIEAALATVSHRYLSAAGVLVKSDARKM